MLTITKYPRTPHLQGSRLQPGDGDLDQVPFADVAGRHVVAEEKIDGANAGVRFDHGAELFLQSRGHFLGGGPREKHFNLFKQWAGAHAGALLEALEDRYILYGEWMYAKHTVFYDRLPHYFLEFDVLDTRTGAFLSTPRRRELLSGLPIVPVPVVYEGPAQSLEHLRSLLTRSLYKGPDWKAVLEREALAAGVPAEQAWRETDPSDLAEGLYVKVEEDGRVVQRMKFIRASFTSAVLDSGTHWLRRPIVRNQLAAGVDLFGGGT
jgi:hypothetical protein